MEGVSLEFIPVLERPNLVPITVLNVIKNWSGPQKKLDFLVAEIDPEFAGGVELCEKYNINPESGANCLIVEGKRGSESTIVACIVPVGYRYDMSGVVRKKLNARQVSVASLDFVLLKTEMEYGSITPIGLPNDWQIFIDPLVFKSKEIIIGGGLKKSKLLIPSDALNYLPNAQIISGLAKLA